MAGLGFLVAMWFIVALTWGIADQGQWFVQMAPVVLLIMLLEGLASWLICRSKLHLTSTDADCYTFWGKRMRVGWDEMVTAKRIRLVGLPHIKITTTQGRTCYLTLYPTDPRGFREVLASVLPESHPVLAALMSENSPR